MSIEWAFSTEEQGDRLLRLEADGSWKTSSFNGLYGHKSVGHEAFVACYGPAISAGSWERLLEEARQSQAAEFDAVGVPSEPAVEAATFDQMGPNRGMGIPYPVDKVRLSIDVVVPGYLSRALAAECAGRDVDQFFAQILEERYAPRDEFGPLPKGGLPKSFPEILEEFDAAREPYDIIFRECPQCQEVFKQLRPRQLPFPETLEAERYCSVRCREAAEAEAVPERRVVAMSKADVNDVWVKAGRVSASVAVTGRDGETVDILMDGGYDIVKTLIDGGGKTYRLELVEVEE